MVQRSQPRSKIDDRAFPVRLLIREPGSQDWLRLARAESWLKENIGVGHYATHGGGAVRLHCRSFYFQTPAAAARFLEEFPEYELHDTTGMETHIKDARRWAERGCPPAEAPVSGPGPFSGGVPYVEKVDLPPTQ